MPAITLHPPGRRVTRDGGQLPGVLETPSGLAIVEIQGTVNSSLSSEELQGSDGSIPLGKLTFPLYDPSVPTDTAWQKKVYLFVGKNQRLTGEVKKLAKPIAVVRRRESDDVGSEELEVAEIVRHKLLFAHRPEPVGTA